MDTLPLSQVLAGQHRQIDQGVKGVIDGNGNLSWWGCNGVRASRRDGLAEASASAAHDEVT